MTSYSIQALEKLVNDGIQTVQFLQQNKEDIQKTYGRSAIQKPSTKERVQAWEAVAESEAGGDHPQDTGAGGGQGVHEDEGQVHTYGHGYSGEEIQSTADISAIQQPRQYNQVWNDQNTYANNIGEGGIPQNSSGQPSTDGYAHGEGDQESSGGNPSGTVDAGDYRELMIFDHETSGIESGASGNQTMKIRNATEEDLGNVMMEGSSKIHKRLRGVAALTEPLPAPRNMGGPVKKGTEESSVSTLLGGRHTSGSGAIHNVHPSLLLQPSAYVHAEGAPECVQDVSETGHTFQSSQAESNRAGTESKIDLLLTQLETIGKKLDMLPEIKEEIKNINKKITNLSLGLSTVEGYIKSMMIIIPGSGKADGDDKTETNPDLKAVIGRDRTRGLDEVKAKRSTLESLNDSLPYDGEIDNEYLVRDLDFRKGNASNFVATESYSSFLTMHNMIKEEVKDPDQRLGLLNWLEESFEKLDHRDLYRALRNILNRIAEEDGDDDED